MISRLLEVLQHLGSDPPANGGERGAKVNIPNILFKKREKAKILRSSECFVISVRSLDGILAEPLGNLLNLNSPRNQMCHYTNIQTDNGGYQWHSILCYYFYVNNQFM